MIDLFSEKFTGYFSNKFMEAEAQTKAINKTITVFIFNFLYLL